MRIAYIVRWDVDSESGVLKKIRDQILAWSRLGHEVRLFALSTSSDVWSGLEELDVFVVGALGMLGRELGGRAVRRAVEAWEPDVAYVRFSTHLFSLEPLFTAVPVVLELNTHDLGEYRRYLSWPKFTLHRVTRRRTLDRAVGMVAVTREIAAKYAEFGKPTAVIGNGIELDSFPTLPAANHDRVHAAFVGSPGSAWHGVDKIIALAEQLSDWHFDLIGPELAGAPENVKAHGRLGRADYERILASTDIAIGTLALHRNDMSEACPLKIREYLAFGIPCIIGFTDTDFPEPVDFVLQLPNEPDNVLPHLDRIRAFGECWRGRRIDRERIAHLDVTVKERQRIEFFRAIASGAERFPQVSAGVGGW